MERASGLAELISKNAAGVGAGAAAPASLKAALIWDGFGLMRPASGIYAHAMNLATALKAQGVEPVILAPGQKCPGFEAWNQWPVGGGVAKLKFVWPLLAGRALRGATAQMPVVYHGLSNFNVPSGRNWGGIRRILTVHDLIPLLEDGGVGPALRLQMQWLMGRAVSCADQIVCVSEWTRRTLIEKWPAAAERCVVIGNGVLDRTVESNPNLRNDAEPTILSVARGERYKDLPMVARIASRGPKSWRFRVVTDPQGAEILGREASELISGGRLVVLQGLSQEALKGEFTRTHAYLQTSWYEGFCLPALDALKVAAPVVYRLGSGMDEVVGSEGGVGLPPTLATEGAVDHWVEAVEAALSLSRDRTFPARASERLRKIPTWSEAAAALVRLYSV